MKKLSTKTAAALFAFILALTSALTLASCSGNTSGSGDTTTASSPASTGSQTDKQTQTGGAIRIMTLSGPTGMGMAKLMSDAENKTTADSYTFGIASAPDEITAELIKGTVDAAAVPVNLAAVLSAKTKGEIQIAAVNTLGVLYMLENGDTVKSVADLAGKTIYATGQGSTPEYILRYVLSKNGIDPDKDVEIVFKAEHSELASLMASGEVVLGMLPEPLVTTAMNGNAKLRVALDLTSEWDKISDEPLIQGCVVVRRDYAEKNRAAFNIFLDEYKASVDYANSDVQGASVLIEKYGIVAKAALAAKALPNCNITYIEGEEMKKNVLSFFKVLYDANPASIGGAIPGDSFFYER